MGLKCCCRLQNIFILIVYYYSRKEAIQKLNSISGERYESLANSYAMTELRSAAIRAPGKSGINFRMPAPPLHRTNFRASRSERTDTCKAGQYAAASAERGVRRRNDNRICAEKGRKTTAMALRPGKKGIHFITQYRSGAGETQALPVRKAKGYCENREPRDTTPEGVGQHIVCIDGALPRNPNMLAGGYPRTSGGRSPNP